MDSGAKRRLPFVSVGVSLTCLILAFAPAALTEAMAFDRQAVLHGQWWRLWTAHLVHFSLQHALADAAFLCLVGVLFEQEAESLRQASILAIAAPCITGGLLVAVPDLQFYRGASGIAMTAAVLAWTTLWARSRQSRGMLVFLALCLAIKVVFEAFGNGSGTWSLPQGIQVVWQAHLFGAITGVLAVLKPDLS